MISMKLIQVLLCELSGWQYFNTLTLGDLNNHCPLQNQQGSGLANIDPYNTHELHTSFSIGGKPYLQGFQTLTFIELK